MTPHKLAMIWLSGDLPMRPRWVGQEVVLRAALRDPVKAAQITAHLNDGSRALECGFYFAIQLDHYRRNPRMWRIVTRGVQLQQRNINNCTRGRPEHPVLP